MYTWCVRKTIILTNALSSELQVAESFMVYGVTIYLTVEYCKIIEVATRTQCMYVCSPHLSPK